MSGIDEIMQNIEIEDDCCEPLTNAERNRILHLITKKTGIAPRKKKRHVMRTMLIAACVTALLAVTTALAAYYLELEKPLGDMLGVTEENFSEIENAVDTPVCSVTDNGVTVNVLQTLADSRTVYAVFEVVAPEGTELQQWYEFERYHFEPSDCWDHPEKYSSFGMDVSVVEADGNRMKCIATAEGFASELPDCEWSLTLENISEHVSSDPEHEWNNIIEGKWQLKWNYSSEKNPDMRELSVNIPMECEERDLAVTDITLSPLSAQFIVRCELTEDEAVKVADNNHERLTLFSSVEPYVYDHLSVKMKDGTVIDWQNAKPFRTGGFPEGENCMIFRYYMRFNNIVEVDDIEGVIVNGTEIKIEDLL